MHMNAHTGVKSYKCSVCEYSAAQKGNLVTHMKIPTGIKPYNCSVCEYSAAQKGPLVRHMTTHKQ